MLSYLRRSGIRRRSTALEVGVGPVCVVGVDVVSAVVNNESELGGPTDVEVERNGGAGTGEYR